MFRLDASGASFLSTTRVCPGEARSASRLLSGPLQASSHSASCRPAVCTRRGQHLPYSPVGWPRLHHPSPQTQGGARALQGHCTLPHRLLRLPSLSLPCLGGPMVFGTGGATPGRLGPELSVLARARPEGLQGPLGSWPWRFPLWGCPRPPHPGRGWNCCGSSPPAPGLAGSSF